jgi:hypothetical protein
VLHKKLRGSKPLLVLKVIRDDGFAGPQCETRGRTKRHDESARTPVAAEKGVIAKKVPKEINSERLAKAIRYLKRASQIRPMMRINRGVP